MRNPPQAVGCPRSDDGVACQELKGAPPVSRTALHASAGYNFVDDLNREIAEGLDINEPDEAGQTPLHHACIHNSLDSARILLAAGADVNPQDQWGNAPLWYAVFSNDSTVEMVRLLVDHGADPAIENNKGNSPLKLARRLQKSDCIAIFED